LIPEVVVVFIVVRFPGGMLPIALFKRSQHAGVILGHASAFKVGLTRDFARVMAIARRSVWLA
jgi:hypothetical protein